MQALFATCPWRFSCKMGGPGVATEAYLTLQGVPTLGTLRWNDKRVSDGRLMGRTATDSNNHDAVDRFGGVNRVGVAGHAAGREFRSVFRGDKG